MYTRYLTLLFLAVARCQQAGDIDPVIKETSPLSNETQRNETGPATLVPGATTPDTQQNRSRCLTPDNQVGECVSYYLCDPEYTSYIINSSVGMINIRLDDDPCSSSYLDLCCLGEHILESSVITKRNVNQLEFSKPTCVLPPYPDHGSYVANIPDAKPGQSYDFFQINVTCNSGYRVVGDTSIICLNGLSTTKIPECVPFCRLPKHPSVDYYCLLTGEVEEWRICNEYEPSNTQVLPKCKMPNYYSLNPLPQMTCIEGSWNYVVTCEAECGRIAPVAMPLVLDGRLTNRGKMPWHAGIYTKTTTPYMQICGGSLVSTTVVISAAHCFWADNDGQVGPLPVSQFAVALGKLHRPWNDPMDIDVQKFDVKEIKLPTRFRGNAANFQEDIALVTLSAEVKLNTHIRPVCLSFDLSFNQRQLREGNLGKVAGWGRIPEDRVQSTILKVVDLPYVDTGKCLEQIPRDFLEYLTSDKICAGYGNGTRLYRGESGEGLVFPEIENTGVTRYYLRGVASVSPNDAFSLNTFTEVLKHEYFIKQGTFT